MRNLTFGIVRTCWKASLWRERPPVGRFAGAFDIADTADMVSSTAGFNSSHHNKCLLQNKNNLESWWLWSTNSISFSKVGIVFGILNLNQMLKVIPGKISNLFYIQWLIFMWCSPVFWIQKKVLALMQNAHEPLQNLHLKWSEWSLMSLYQGQLCFCLHPCNIRASTFTHLDTSLSSQKQELELSMQISF